jgi:hypothetical protein
MPNWLYIFPLEDFNDLIKSSHLIICDSYILFILVIFMLLTFLLGHKRICTICTFQCWLVWSKHLLGFSSCESSENPHFYLPHFVNKVLLNIYVFCSWMKRWIPCNKQDILTIIIQRNLLLFVPELLHKFPHPCCFLTNLCSYHALSFCCG